MTEGQGGPVNLAPAAPMAERVVYVQPPPVQRRSVFKSILVYVGAAIIVFSILMNLVFLSWMPVLAGAGDDLREKYVSGNIASDRKVAIVSVAGIIADSQGGLMGPGGNFRYVVRQLQKARRDKKVVGVVLEVNSPGGGVTASDVILNEVVRTQKAGKRVVVWMGSVAASGGYYVSCKADAIYASPTTLTGSIGVILSLYNFEELSTKVGVKPVIIKCGEFKDMGSPFRNMTEAEKKRFEALAEGAFSRFKEVVAKGRKLTDKQVDQIADGAVLNTQQALGRGLIDNVGYLEDAIADARGKFTDVAVVRYQPALGLLGALLAASDAPTREIRVHIDSPLPVLSPGLHYLWLPGAAVGR